MAGAKKERQNKFLELILFIFLVLFPFGVLLSLNIRVSEFEISVHPIDIVALGSLLYTVFRERIFRKHYFYLIAFIFPLFLSLSIYSLTEIFVGFLYLIRFIAYASLFFALRRLIKNSFALKETVFQSLLVISFFVAIFGWIQYFWLPDLRTLKLLGWDDHLYRLVGTFLDPAFTGIIIVLGAFISFSLFLNNKQIFIFLIFTFLVISLAFTYSRASYLALFSGLLYFLKKSKSILLISLTLSVFIFSIPLLPRPSSEGVKLERAHSVYAKIQNYKETFKIFVLNPVFGVGFNNICSARVRMFNDNISSHSCYGADSSLLFILATTGVVGFILIVNILLTIYRNIANNFYGDSLKASGLAIFVHSQFVGSLAYPWIVGYIALLTALSIKNILRTK